MQAREILAQARDTMNARRVFGEPIDRDGVTVIPVMRLLGGAGGGGGEENASLGGGAPDSEPTAEGEHATGLQGAAASFGVGFGVKASPAGVYVIKGDDVRWMPAVDPERLVLIGGAIGVFTLLILRSIVRAALKR